MSKSVEIIHTCPRCLKEVPYFEPHDCPLVVAEFVAALIEWRDARQAIFDSSTYTEDAWERDTRAQNALMALARKLS